MPPPVLPPRFLAPVLATPRTAENKNSGDSRFALGAPILNSLLSKPSQATTSTSPTTPIPRTPTSTTTTTTTTIPIPPPITSTTNTFPPTSIYHRPPPPPPLPRPKRHAIRIWCTSWNMGDALPKGHLEELFGPVPSYTPPEEPILEFPSLLPSTPTPNPSSSSPIDPTKPQPQAYHIILVSTQETPTPSGVPRGLGGGVTKGLGVGGQKEKEKLREKEWRKGLRGVREEIKGLAAGSGAGGVVGVLKEVVLGDKEKDTAEEGPGSTYTPAGRSFEPGYAFPPPPPPPTSATGPAHAPIPIQPGSTLSPASALSSSSSIPGQNNNNRQSYLPFTSTSNSTSTATTPSIPIPGQPDSNTHDVNLVHDSIGSGSGSGSGVGPRGALGMGMGSGFGSGSAQGSSHGRSLSVNNGPGGSETADGLGMGSGAGGGTVNGTGTGTGTGNVLGNRGWSDMLEDYFCHGIDEPLASQSNPHSQTQSLNSSQSQSYQSLSSKPSLSRRGSRARSISQGNAQTHGHGHGHGAAGGGGSQHGLSHSHSLLHLHHPVPTRPTHLSVHPQPESQIPITQGGPEHGLGLGFVPSEGVKVTTPGMSPSVTIPGSGTGSVAGGTNSSPVDKMGQSFAAGAKASGKAFRLDQPPAPGLRRMSSEPVVQGVGRLGVGVSVSGMDGSRREESVSGMEGGYRDEGQDARARVTSGQAAPFRENISDNGVDVHKELPAVPEDSEQIPTIPGPPPMHLAPPQQHGSQIPRVPSPLRRDLTPLTIPSTPMSEFPPDLTRNKNGPYHFLVKERLLGLYVAVFIHKDCLDWVEGYDHDYVPAGLVGGRVGNKGGLGISLKIAGHRFLFVNSHLAAHTGKLEARLANVKKIKAELQLDTFLPEGDPRARAPDITDRFDTCLWMGDLNFRLEVSRLHADWLVSRKEYAQALEFDQLRKVQKNGTGFADFTEAPIDFPPTFKYDVWHSAKRTRSLQKKKDAKAKNKEQGAIKEENEEECEAFDPDEESEGTSICDRRASLDSTKWLSSSFGTTPPELAIDEEDDEEDDPVTVQQPGRPISAVARTSALKAKSRFLKFVKGASLSPSLVSPSQSPRSTSPLPSPPNLPAPIPITHGLAPPNPGFASPHGVSPSASPTPSDAGDIQAAAASPTNRPGLSRNLSTKLRRKMSGKNRGGDSDSDSSSDEGEDTRAGVYDTSNKQRVPSWCDRVLWKSALYPADHPVDLPARPRDQGPPTHRLSLLFAQRAQGRNGDRKLSNSGSMSDLRSAASVRSLHPPVSRTGQPITVNATMEGRSAGAERRGSASIRSGASEPHSPRQPTHTGVAQPDSRSPTSPFGMAAPPVLHRAISPRSTADAVSGAKRWFHNLPILLTHGHHAGRSTIDEQTDESSVPLPDHRKGDVECIKYGTIDDAGMRRLEGRSDHRPVLFAAAVYV